MPLYEPTNIIPSLATNSAVVVPTDIVSIQWQINGNTPMTGFQVDFYKNDAASTFVYSTGKITEGCPFVGVDRWGNSIPFSYITASSWINWGISAGNEYKFKITQFFNSFGKVYYITPGNQFAVNTTYYFATEIGNVYFTVTADNVEILNGSTIYYNQQEGRGWFVNNGVYHFMTMGLSASAISGTALTGTVLLQSGEVEVLIQQSSESLIRARGAATVSISPYTGVIKSAIADITATYKQSQNDVIRTVQWQIKKTSTQKIIYDTGAVNTPILNLVYAGLYNGEMYDISCTVETIYGQISTTGWISYSVEYPQAEYDGNFSAVCDSTDGSIKLTWDENLQFIDGLPNGQYSLANGNLFLPAGSSVTWDKVGNLPMQFSSPWTFVWKGDLPNTDFTFNNLKFNAQNFNGKGEINCAAFFEYNGETYIAISGKSGNFSTARNQLYKVNQSTNSAEFVSDFGINATYLVFYDMKAVISANGNQIRIIATFENYIYSYKLNTTTMTFEEEVVHENTMGYAKYGKFDVFINNNVALMVVGTVTDNSSTNITNRVQCLSLGDISSNSISITAINQLEMLSITKSTSATEVEPLDTIESVIKVDSSHVLVTGYITNSPDKSGIMVFNVDSTNGLSNQQFVTVEYIRAGKAVVVDNLVWVILGTTFSPEGTFRPQRIAYFEIPSDGNYTSVTIREESQANINYNSLLSITQNGKNYLVDWRTNGNEATVYRIDESNGDYVLTPISNILETSSSVSNVTAFSGYGYLLFGNAFYNNTYQIGVLFYFPNGAVPIAKLQGIIYTTNILVENGQILFTINGSSFSSTSTFADIPSSATKAILFYDNTTGAGRLRIFYFNNTATAGESYITAQAPVESLNSIEVMGEHEIEYVTVLEGTYQNNWKNIFNNAYEPTYENPPINNNGTKAPILMTATFKTDLQAGESRGITIFRTGYKNENGTLVPVELKQIATIEDNQNSIIDYNVASGMTYKYTLWVFGENNIFVSSKTTENNICMVFNKFSLISTVYDESDESYHVQKVYMFSLNLAEGNISNNNNPSINLNFTPYPTRMASVANYASGNLEGLIGAIDMRKNIYKDTIELEKELYALSTSSNTLFLRDMKGHVRMVHTSAPIQQETNLRTLQMQNKIILPWVEIGDASNVKIIK